MHWGRRSLSHSGANELMPAALDPFSKQPELKHAAVQVARLDLPWQALVLRRETDGTEQALAWMARLQPLLARFRYASLTLAGRGTATVVLRLAGEEAPPAEWLEEIDAIVGLQDADCLSYRDRRRGIRKKARLDEGRLTGLHLSGETAAAAWLKDMVVDGRPAGDVRRWLLAPLSAPPEGIAVRGRIVCACNNVAEKDILAAVAAGANLETLQETLRCGTSCGSCVPELKRLVAAGKAAA
jgi:assimilatory nitrate reductase catalytic subunit